MMAYYTDMSRMTGNLDDLVPHGFLRNPDLIYDLRLVQRADGSLGFTAQVSRREEDPRTFRYGSNSGRGVEPVE